MNAVRRRHSAPGLKIGLYGGSFDPPHAGHAHVATAAKRRLGLDEVWWLVSPGNPFKAHQPAPIPARSAAISALVRDPAQVPTDLEADLPSNRTADVIATLQARHRGVRFVWIMGADGFADLHRWHNWRDILANIPVCVVSRPGSGLKARTSPAARHAAKHRVLENHAQSLVFRRSGWTYLCEPLHQDASRNLRA